MPGALVSTVSKVLKDRYLGPLNRQLNDEVLVTQLLELDSKAIDLDGNVAVVPLHKGRSTGIGARLESETLPSAGNQVFDKVTYDLTYQYGRAQFSGQAIQKTKTDAGAFIRVMTEELDRLREDLALDMGRQVYGNGDASIATISPGAASATQTITSAEPVDKGYLYPNMIVDIGTLANPVASGDSRVIQSVDATTVVFTASVTTTTNDLIFREDNAAASSVSKELMGLQGLIATSNNSIGGLNSATAGNEFWRNIKDAGGGAISLSNLMIVHNKVKAAGGKAPDELVLTTDGISRRLFESAEFKTNVRFVNEVEFNAGFSGLKFSAGGAPVNLVSDRLAPWGKVHFIDKKRIKVFSPGGWDFLSRDGLTIRWVSDKDAYQAVLFRYINLGTGRRNTSAVMSGLTDTGY
jgi:hypothetical protein